MTDLRGSLLGAEELAALEAFDEGASGYFGRMLDYLEHFEPREWGEFCLDLKG